MGNRGPRNSRPFLFAATAVIPALDAGMTAPLPVYFNVQDPIVATIYFTRGRTDLNSSVPPWTRTS